MLTSPHTFLGLTYTYTFEAPRFLTTSPRTYFLSMMRHIGAGIETPMETRKTGSAPD